MQKYESIIEIIKRRVLRGSLQPGSKLPSEKDIAASTRVSVQTVNKAVSSLVSAGYLFRKRGTGTFVAEDSKLRELLETMPIAAGVLYEQSIGKISDADGVLAKITLHLQSLLSQENIDWTIISAKDGMDYTEYLSQMDCFITVGDVPEGFVERVSELHIPTVTFNRDFTEMGLASVIVNTESITQLVKFMCDRRCERFVYVTDDSIKQVYEIRYGAFHSALCLHGLDTAGDRLVISRADLESRILKPNIRRRLEEADFVFLPNDGLAILFVQLLNQNGIAVPMDISVCGYDDSVAGRHFGPSLTTIGYDILAACTAIVDQLQKMVRRKKHSLNRSVESWVIMRESTRNLE